MLVREKKNCLKELILVQKTGMDLIKWTSKVDQSSSYNKRFEIQSHNEHYIILISVLWQVSIFKRPDNIYTQK